MITEASTIQDLVATIRNARLLGAVSFEEGCRVLDAIELFDRHTAGDKLGTWLACNDASQNTLRFFPTANTPEDRLARHQMCAKLAQDVVTWSLATLDTLEIGELFTAWVVIDRATHVVWVECNPVSDGQVIHPRALREASEFPSSSRGTVSVYTFLHTGAPWREVRDSVTEAYYEARDLLNQFEGCDHSVAQGAAAARKLLHCGEGPAAPPVSDGAVTGKGSMGINFGDGGAK